MLHREGPTPLGQDLPLHCKKNKEEEILELESQSKLPINACFD